MATTKRVEDEFLFIPYEKWLSFAMKITDGNVIVSQCEAMYDMAHTKGMNNSHAIFMLCSLLCKETNSDEALSDFIRYESLSQNSEQHELPNNDWK